MSDADLRLPDEMTEALNEHGVFLKKEVIRHLQTLPDIQIFGEEVGESFGSTRVADVIAFKSFQNSHLFIVIECKRARPSAKSWLFLRDCDRCYRVVRQAWHGGASSIFDESKPPYPPVCSEGYEYVASEKGDKKGKIAKTGKADQSPIFEAGTQLASAYLGFMKRILAAGSSGRGVERYDRIVPLLVTTAPLMILQSTLPPISLETGNISNPPVYLKQNFVILKQPMATPEGLATDFRDNSGDPQNQSHKESIYVVQAEALREFFAPSHLEYLMTKGL
jgi:hypothetical protein